jgi:primosomal protein N' (replication factor Y)
VHLVYHKDARVTSGGVMRCHYCGFENRLPTACPMCNRRVSVFGLGTQRVEEELTRKLPNVKLLRMDSDAMRTGRDYHRSLEAFGRREVDLLVGTQMIAKGLDFPNVRLVGVVSADTALHLPDFRAAERTFQLVSQVSGRSGRGEAAGRVVVQTFTPDVPAIRFAAAHDYVGFATAELAQRHRAALPPVTRMARIVCRDRDMDKALGEADRLNAVLLELNERLQIGATILGPLTPPIARIGGYHRVQIEIIAANAARLQKLLTAARQADAMRSDAHMAVDVDPISLL